jgi:hypothetical protein
MPGVRAALVAPMAVLGALAPLGCAQVLGLGDFPPIAGDAGSANPDADQRTENEVLDPDYENQTAAPGGPLMAPWSGEGPGIIGVDDMDGVGGSKCAYISDDGSGAWSDVIQTIHVTPQANLTLSALIQTQSPTSTSGSTGPFPSGFLGARTLGGTVLGQEAYGTSTDYAQISVTFNSGANDAVVIFAGFTSVVGQATWIHVDDWSPSLGAP